MVHERGLILCYSLRAPNQDFLPLNSIQVSTRSKRQQSQYKLLSPQNPSTTVGFLAKIGDDELSWPEYYTRLQSWRYNAGFSSSFGSHNKMTTPIIQQGSLMSCVLPKTLRLPK